ncbi:HK97-gp10 family putative phage morphogenesis protein [Croceibacterium aestuarii]|uniref:HK97-gp10 family putative phage morphogenesis protein n=1 Tax=Croceibacterium aestuarii TaxID=3064139 RepID=UPI00272EE1B3|nr:HK97-gp10 family putative phage morphogenesis protein [Croceibacterium sp. D39]
MPMKFKGADKHLKRLRTLAAKVPDEASEMVLDAAKAHAAEAKRLIGAGSVSAGKHTPSAPGQPPRTDTGALADSVRAERVGPYKAVSKATAPHAAPLEFGTVAIAERPFMRPAAKKVRKVIGDHARSRVRRVTGED